MTRFVLQVFGIGMKVSSFLPAGIEENVRFLRGLCASDKSKYRPDNPDLNSQML